MSGQAVADNQARKQTSLGCRFLLMCTASGRPPCCKPTLLRAQLHTVHTRCSRPETHGVATTSLCTPVPCSSALQISVNCCCIKSRSRLVCSALERVQPRVVSYEEQVTTMREGLADCYEAEDNWAEAAKTLAMIDLDSGERQPRQISPKGLSIGMSQDRGQQDASAMNAFSRLVEPMTSRLHGRLHCLRQQGCSRVCSQWATTPIGRSCGRHAAVRPLGPPCGRDAGMQSVDLCTLCTAAGMQQVDRCAPCCRHAATGPLSHPCGLLQACAWWMQSTNCPRM